mmetsp:Transcript_11560/g.21190  ORF Transcript_11560/g.21190 Transcript_11560/m.21190 type:complete len:251 (-) Transcript_11560:151-903(-)
MPCRLPSITDLDHNVMSCIVPKSFVTPLAGSCCTLHFTLHHFTLLSGIRNLWLSSYGMPFSNALWKRNNTKSLSSLWRKFLYDANDGSVCLWSRWKILQTSLDHHICKVAQSKAHSPTFRSLVISLLIVRHSTGATKSGHSLLVSGFDSSVCALSNMLVSSPDFILRFFVGGTGRIRSSPNPSKEGALVVTFKSFSLAQKSTSGQSNARLDTLSSTEFRSKPNDVELAFSPSSYNIILRYLKRGFRTLAT